VTVLPDATVLIALTVTDHAHHDLGYDDIALLLDPGPDGAR
jgi:hypothetical protein